jgi:hypothetical protein
MSAFLFTGWASVFDPKRGLHDTCSSVILRGCEEPEARARFEDGLQHAGRDEGESPRKIEKIITSPIVDRLFTETGDEPLNWVAVEAQAGQALNAGEEAYEQQGYWADCNELVPPAHLAFDLHQLQQSLPDDVRSGLNWSADAQNFFLVSALVIPSAIEPEPDYDNPDAANDGEQPRRDVPFPELAEREATAVIKARNTVVAAWLWRRYAAQTPLARNPIRVDGWCTVVGPEKPRE